MVDQRYADDKASPNDRGIGFNSEDAMDHQSEWGANRLGEALMKVRRKLRYVEG